MAILSAANITSVITVRFGDDLYASSLEPTRLVSLYAAGSKTTAFVNPADPDQSVLDRIQVSGGVPSELGVGIFIAIDGVLVGWLISRMQR
jgi:hypothetical protein